MQLASAPLHGPIFALLILVAACDGGGDHGGHRGGDVAYELIEGSVAGGGKVVHDLISELSRGESWFEKVVIRPWLYEDRVHLTGGWSFPDPDPRPDENPAIERWLWATGLEAELTFHLGVVAPRRLRFKASAYLPDGTDGNDVAVRLNGEPVEGFTLRRERQLHELDLPAPSQRAGLNRLRFTFTRSIRPIDAGHSNDARPLSGSFGQFEFEIEDPAVRARLLASQRLLPRGSSPTHEGRAIEQVSGSLLRSHLKVPEAAVFTAQLGFVRRSTGALDQARFRLTALRDGQPALTLLDEPVPWTEDGRLDPVSVALDELAGQVVALELRVAAGPGQDPVVGVWGEPRVSTRAAPPSPPAPALPALVEARRRLRHAPVVVILLDAFNPRFMTAYGGRPDLTPTLDALAQQGVLFEEALASATYTLSSVGTILTSQPAWKHGVWNVKTPLRPTVETWPERFSAAGYRTAGIVCSVNGSSTFGFERGFETFVEVWEEEPPMHVVQAEETLPVLERALAARAGDDRPLFLWMHILEPHEPYDDTPAPWRGRFDPGYDGEITGSTEMLTRIRHGVVVPSPRDIEHLKAEYEEGLGYVDEVLSRIRARLAAAGILDEGVLAIVSDHGEAFMEHRPKGRVLISHGTTVYDEMARVPLVVRLPDRVAELGARGRRVRPRVTGSDLLPTLADLVGVAPIESASGQSFASLLFDSGSDSRPVLLSHAWTLAGDRFMPEFALWGDGYKYLYSSGGGDELYRTGHWEEHDLSEELPVLAGWMRQRLRRELDFDPDTGAVPVSTRSTELDAGVLEQMRALGYAR
jgi:arylsulfatase A-like enzyme